MDTMSKLYERATAALKVVAKSHHLDVPGLRTVLEPSFAAAGFRAAVPHAQQSLLVIRLDRIGDFILMSPFLRELRRGYPAAWITLVVSPVVENLAVRCPYVNEVLTLELTEPQLTVSGLTKALEFARDRLWARHFDRAFCPRASRSVCVDGSVAYLSGARERSGFSANTFGHEGEPRRWEVLDQFFTQVVQLPQRPLQELEHNLLLLQETGVMAQDQRLEVWFDAADAARAATLCEGFAPDCRLAAVSLGASEPRKTYPVELLAQALTPLAADGVAFLLLGGPGDRAAGETLASMLPEGTARNLAGAGPLRVSEALIARTELYIGNDTGLLHMAAALRRPVVEISCDLPDTAVPAAYLHLPVRFAPWQVPYILLRPAQGMEPCRGMDSPLGCMASTVHCIAQIPPEQVTAAARSLLAIRF